MLRDGLDNLAAPWRDLIVYCSCWFADIDYLYREAVREAFDPKNLVFTVKLMRSIPLIFSVIFFFALGKEDSLNENSANFESWYPRYNNYISSWLTEEVSAREKAISELNKELEIARSKI